MASLDRELSAGPTPPRAGRWSQYTQPSRQIKQAGLLGRTAEGSVTVRPPPAIPSIGR
jgi:hypothetical protein